MASAPQAYLDDLNKAFAAGGVEASRRLMERKRDEWKNMPLNVAVTGSSGVGKSSLINAIRRLTGDDDGAAPVGVKETTVDIQSYSHPRNPLLKFWDLPGVGTDRFPRETYLSGINVDRYDFFLLITSDRFTQDDTWLGEELHKRNKKYFFGRTKMGNDISDNKKAHPKTHNEDTVVREIRDDIKQHLRANRCPEVPVFLIDSYKLKKFEFDQLEHRLVSEFPNLKRSALVLSLKATSIEMIQLKVKELRSRASTIAGLSAAVAALPIPGLSTAVDLGIVTGEANFYSKQLGLHESVGDKELKTIIDDIKSTSLKESSYVEAMRLIPLIGLFLTAPTSYAGTYHVLNKLLDKLEIAGLKVVTAAAERAAAAAAEDSDDD